MINPKLARCLRNVVPLMMHRDLTSRLSSSSQNPFRHLRSSPFFVFRFHHSLPKISSTFDRSFTTNYASTEGIQCHNQESPQSCTNDEVESMDCWEEEDEADSFTGDTYDEDEDEPIDYCLEEYEPDPIINLRNCPWGEKVHDIAVDVLCECSLDLRIIAFVTYPYGEIYVRLERLYDKEFGCPDMYDVQSYSDEYQKRLDEAGEFGEIPRDLDLVVTA